MRILKIVSILILLLNVGCQAQTNNKMENNNPLLCDPESGVCEIPTNKTNSADSSSVKSDQKPVKIIYYTDPICSSCWGIEPQLRKLKLEYGENIEIEYRMGGLLPDWSYNSGGISKPSDVAHHWDEVSRHYDMPIDGDIWLEDPLNSSYPPSIAFKAAQLQDEEKAQLFMREIREMVFLKKINIAKWENLAIAAKNVELNVEELKKDFDGKAKNLFEDDLKKAREYGVRGFPTIFFVDSVGHKEVVYGSKPYTNYESAILKINSTITKSEYGKNWETLFSKYNSLTAKEFSVISERPRIESEDLLNKLSENGNLYKVITKNGSIWSLVK